MRVSFAKVLKQEALFSFGFSAASAIWKQAKAMTHAHLTLKTLNPKPLNPKPLNPITPKPLNLNTSLRPWRLRASRPRQP